ncbi:MAG: YihA family ribosome biogenesis GTP-binding protein [Tidjanibacter sp.]|nr:YihA family ribosome biogenesis GTP-binding protein [Tidjanibacter sp.]MBR4064198.1 YihA family ribosome biogenesis GTP-binding protein [Tidjanibacter sp.]MBR6813140.1 YihA family ribosome biogenesis GTP-binding protein [Tidjanibacter sp.]MBR7102641.1 YihA family ribosome biogenesis GTP-binding protein [Tidjanibacter sp.]
MNITSAEFKFSSGKISQIPDHGKREFAFIGRSNVGKSSLVNMLTGRNLAKVSATPGKTQLINHFLVNDSWWLVDLPGYGYARTSRNARESFTKIITDYVTAAPALHYLFVLIDSRHEAMKIDLEFLQMLGREGVPFGIVFTKSDKLSARQLRLNVEAYKRRLSEWWEELPNIFITSSEHRKGRDEILDFIEECLKDC